MNISSFSDVLPSIIMTKENMFANQDDEKLEFNKCFIFLFKESDFRRYKENILPVIKVYKTFPLFVAVFLDKNVEDDSDLSGHEYPLVLLDLDKVSAVWTDREM